MEKTLFRKTQDKLYEMITPRKGGVTGAIYAVFMVSVIMLSIMPFF